MSIIDILFPYQKRFFLNNKKRKIWISSRQIGKSFCIAGILCYKALSKKNGLSLCISVNARSASEIVRKCAQFAEAIKMKTNGQIDYSVSYDGIKFSNGSRVLSLPSTADSLRGYSAQCVVVDEACFIPHLDDILQAIAPTLTRDENAELIFTTTPAGKNGYFYELYQNALANQDDFYVQTTTIHEAIADGLKIDLDSLHTLCPDPNIFKQEYECQFLDSVNSLIDPNLIQYYNEDQNDIVEYFMGADWARTSDGTSISVIGRKHDGKLYLVELVNLHNVEYSKQISVATQLFHKYKPRLFLGDAGGLGSPLMEQLNRTVSTRIQGFTFTSTNKTDCYEYFRKNVFDRNLWLKEDYKRDITQDLQLIDQVITENGKVQYMARRFNGSHADNVSGLILALQAERQSRQNSMLPTASPFKSAFGDRRSYR